MKDLTEKINLRLTPKLKTDLEKIAERQRLKLSQLIRQALFAYAEKWERIIKDE